MPTRVQLPDGNIGEFPDGMSNSQIEAVLQKQFPPKAAHPGMLEPHGKWNLGDVLRGAGAGVKQLVMHPLDTGVGMVQGALASGMSPTGEGYPSTAATGRPQDSAANLKVQMDAQEGQRQQAEQIKEHPAFAAGSVVGPALLTHALGKFIPKVAEVPGKVVRAGQEAITKTSPSDVANLVRETSAKNVEEVKAASEKQVKQDTDRKLDLKKHFDKTQEVQARNEEKTAPVDRKEALNRGVEQLDTKFHEDLSATEKDVNAKAGEKYGKLRSALKNEKSGMYQPKDEEGHIQGEPISVPQRLFDAADSSMRGSDNAPTIVKDLGRRVQQGEISLSYNDLQGYREEIGRELRKGTLAPDVFDAYKRMMPMIDDAMQEIAERKGLGGAQTEARNYYRQYAQTFLDKDSPLRQAINEGKSLKREPGSVIESLRGKNAAVQTLAKYNPELARRANTVRGYQSEAASLPAKPGKVNPLPKLTPAKPPVEAKTTTLTPQTLGDLKGANVDKAAADFRAPNKLATTFLGYDLMRHALNTVKDVATANFGSAAKDVFGAVRDVGIRVGYAMGSGKMADILEKPAVRQGLAQITDRDIAELRKLPPDQQAALGSELKALVDAAPAKGVKVSAPLAAWVGAVAGKQANQKRPGDILKPQ
jgi:hypothetical protein